MIVYIALWESTGKKICICIITYKKSRSQTGGEIVLFAVLSSGLWCQWLTGEVLM